jgi:hypothetical protein
MPQFSALQKKYERRITVIGIDARETEQTDGSLEYVKAFVEKKGDDMAYTVAMDDPVKHPAFDAWMSAGGAYGIPTTFVVDGAGKLVWVGHPSGKWELAFNNAVEQALNGTTDLVAAKAAQEEVNRNTAKRLKDVKLLKRMREAQEKNDYAMVVAEADKVIVQEPAYGPELFRKRIGALLHLNEERALADARYKAGDPAYEKALGAQNKLEYWGAIGALIARQEGLSKKSYQLAVDYLEKFTAAKADSYSSWVSLALAHHRLGNIQLAVAAQQKAIAIAKETGITEDRLEGLRKSLVAYQGGEG